MYRYAILLLLPLAAVVNVVGDEKAANNDLKLFQGTWEPVFAKNPEGSVASAEDLKATRLVVKGNKFTLMSRDASFSGTFTIDPSKSPKAIEFLLADSKSPDEKFFGVYEIRGDRRLSCFALPKQERPREIRPTAKGYLMFEWKPAAQ